MSSSFLGGRRAKRNCEERVGEEEVVAVVVVVDEEEDTDEAVNKVDANRDAILAHAGWPRKRLYPGALNNEHSTHTARRLSLASPRS
jgi:hypothetical protein